MPGEEISPELRHFIQTTINSIDQLEVLLFLMSNPDRHWSPDEIGARIRVAPETVAQKLRELREAKLLTGENDRYRYAPGSRAIAAEVAESLDRAYREGRDTVIQLIYSRPMDNIKIFADAFRIKRSDD